jgi:hypothetical protein
MGLREGQAPEERNVVSEQAPEPHPMCGEAPELIIESLRLSYRGSKRRSR